MNYRHAFHAGNFADVVKHAVLARILVHLLQKPAPFRVIDTHAGIGVYDLEGDEAGRTGEWRNGIGRVIGAALEPAEEALLAPLIGVVTGLNGSGSLRLYPGSPAIAEAMLRSDDRLIANELHPVDADVLDAWLAGVRNAKVMRLDGYVAARSLVPPPERRGLVVIDPPFEAADEFERLAAAIADVHRRFATGIVLAWYPLKDRGAVARLHTAVAVAGIRRVLRIEHWTRTPGGLGPLAGAGLLVVNPPWRLDADAAGALPPLAARLATGDGAGARVDWLVPEGAP